MSFGHVIGLGVAFFLSLDDSILFFSTQDVLGIDIGGTRTKFIIRIDGSVQTLPPKEDSPPPGSSIPEHADGERPEGPASTLKGVSHPRPFFPMPSSRSRSSPL